MSYISLNDYDVSTKEKIEEELSNSAIRLNEATENLRHWNKILEDSFLFDETDEVISFSTDAQDSVEYFENEINNEEALIEALEFELEKISNTIEN